MTLRLQLYQPWHDFDGFFCGHPPFDYWIQTRLEAMHAARLVRAHVATEQVPQAIGLYTLRAGVVARNDVLLGLSGAGGPYPAWHIEMLAVDRPSQARGIGTALLVDALRRAESLSDQVGAFAVTLDVLVDAQFQRRRDFYLRLGFRELGDPGTHRLYMLVRDIRATLGRS